ncbi:metal-dependent hydrolase [Sulfurimonas sp.]
MTAKGHMALSSAITLGGYDYIFTQYTGNIDATTLLPYSIIFYGVSLVGSLLPDIDEENSYIGHKLIAFSVVFSTIFKHRTFTHYLLTPLLLVLVSLFVKDITTTIVLLALAWGMFLHDCGDMLTKGGIKGFFFPLFANTRVVLLPEFLRFRTFSFTEYVFIYFVLLPLNLYLLYSLYETNVFGLQL